MLRVVRMVDDLVLALFLEHRVVPRPAPPTSAGHEQCATTTSHPRAYPVGVWAHDLQGTAYHDLVSTFSALAAPVEGDKEIVELEAGNNYRLFEGEFKEGMSTIRSGVRSFKRVNN